MSEPFIGMIIQVGFNFAPVGWATCSGQLLSISQNSAVFALLGTTYGGNGTTTFGLPNLQGRVAIGAGQSPGTSNYVQGQSAGTETVALNSTNMPAHTHTLNVSSTKASAQIPPAGGTLGHSLDINTPVTSLPAIYCPAGTAVNTALAQQSIGLAGNNIPISIVQPYLAILNCIALQGLFPSRN